MKNLSQILKSKISLEKAMGDLLALRTRVAEAEDDARIRLHSPRLSHLAGRDWCTAGVAIVPSSKKPGERRSA